MANQGSEIVSQTKTGVDRNVTALAPGSVDDQSVDQAELTVIIPVFNEIDTLAEVLNRVVSESTPKEVVIVDDGCTDGTTQSLATWESEYRSMPSPQHVRRVLVLRHSVNRGKGAAIRSALEHVRSEYVVVQDADLEVLPQEYPRLLEPLVAGGADFVIGFRTQAGPSSTRYVHSAGICLLNLVVRILYGQKVKDEACCFKMLRTRDLRRMNLECKGFEFCPEVVGKAARLGLRFSEVPISYVPRNIAKGKKLRLRDGLRAMLTLWKYRSWQKGL